MSEAVLLSTSPSVVLFRNFITNQERLHLLEISRERRKRSTVVDNATGANTMSDYRTGFMAELKGAEDPVIADIEMRAARLTNTRVAQGEPMQVIGYHRGEQYKKHNDWFDPGFAGAARHLRWGGQRVKTVMVYLKAPEKGGETAFVNLGLKVRPEECAALVWDNVLPDGSIDHRVLHAGLPVRKGEKVIMTRWIRARAFDGTENALSSDQLREKLCSEDIKRILSRYGCQLISKPVIVEGKILAESRVFVAK